MDTPTRATTRMLTPAATHSRAHTQWSPQVQALCDRYDDSMRGHSEGLAQQLLQFRKDKAALMDASRREWAHKNPLSPQLPNADSIVDDMLPASLKSFLAFVMVMYEPVEETSCQQSRQLTKYNVQEKRDEPAVKPPMLPVPISVGNPFFFWQYLQHGHLMLLKLAAATSKLWHPIF